MVIMSIIKDRKATIQTLDLREGFKQSVKIPKTTRSMDLKAESFTRKVIFEEKSNEGILRSLGMKSTVNTFIVTMVVDGKTFLNRKFTDIVLISAINTDIQAFTDADGNYVLFLGSIAWQNSISIQIISSVGTITFSEIFGLWDLF